MQETTRTRTSYALLAGFLLLVPALAQSWAMVGNSTSMPTQNWNSITWQGSCVYVSSYLGNSLSDSLKGIWRSCNVTGGDAMPTTGWTKVFSNTGTAGHSRASVMIFNSNGDIVFDQNGNGAMWLLTTPSGTPGSTQAALQSTRGLGAYGGNFFTWLPSPSSIYKSTDQGATWSSTFTTSTNAPAGFVQTSDGCMWILYESANAIRSCDGWGSSINVGTAPNSVNVFKTAAGSFLGADVDNYPRLWDGATTWSRYDTGIAGSTFFFTPNTFAQGSDGVLWTCGKGLDPNNVTQKQGVYAFKSTDNGAHWTNASTGLNVYNDVHTGLCLVGPDGYLYLGVAVNDSTLPSSLGTDSGIFRISVGGSVNTAGGSSFAGKVVGKVQ